jgi:hypothetical protein
VPPDRFDVPLVGEMKEARGRESLDELGGIHFGD